MLITGGTSGLGALTARHLVSAHGVRSLVLASRRGAAAPAAAALVAELSAAGCGVRVEACDVSNRAAVEQLLAAAPDELPLRGVVHAAGALDDATVASLTPAQVARVFAPKADAAWHLHELTRDRELTLFAMFSSAAAAVGSAGQANYAAANAFLDALAHHRRSLGLPGHALAWGLRREGSELLAGLSAEDTMRIERSGFAELPVNAVTTLLDTALAGAESQPLLARFDGAALRELAAVDLLPAVLASLVPERRRRAEDAGAGLRARLDAAAPAERPALVLDLVRAETAAVLGHGSAAAVDARLPFKELGFDSLAAVTLRNRLRRATGLRLPATLVFDHPSVEALAGHVCDELVGPEPSPLADAHSRLDGLETALAAATAADEDERAALRERLRAMAAALTPSDDSDRDHDRARARIEAASVEEIFGLLDEELGHAHNHHEQPDEETRS